MSKVSILPLGEWIFYLGENHNNLDQSKCGKWMYFFNDVSSAAEMCEKAIVNDICVESKEWWYDNQTRAGMYGDDFIGEIKLEQFLNLNTGEWLV